MSKGETIFVIIWFILCFGFGFIILFDAICVWGANAPKEETIAYKITAFVEKIIKKLFKISKGR